MRKALALASASDDDEVLTGLRRSLVASRLTFEGRTPAPIEGEVLAPGADIVFSPSPFQSGVRRYVLPEGGTIEDAIALAGVGARLRNHLGVYVGDERIPRPLWSETRPRAGAAIYIRAELAGGGKGGKNPLRAILTIALVVVATMAGNFVAGLSAFAKGGSLAGFAGVAKVATAALVFSAGQALVNHLIPPPKPSNNFAFDQQPGNPYASITGLQNRAVPYGPIPRVMGERRIYPMIAAHPYTEMSGKKQYLRMLLLAGYGRLDISDIRIGNTPIGNFAGAQVEIREGTDSDDPITLYTKNIDEEPLSILLETEVEETRVTSVSDAQEISIDITFPQGLAEYDSNGKRNNRHVNFTVLWKPESGGSYQSAVWINGSSQYGTGTNGQINATAASAQTEVRSGRFAVPSPGEYRVLIKRTTAAASGQQVDVAYWTMLRSIRPGNPVNKSGLALIALRLEATDQLNGAPDAINCLVKSYLPVWDAEEEQWNEEITRNPAWECVDLLRRRGGQTMIADSRIDLEAFTEWAEACDEEASNAEEPKWQCDLVLEGGSIFTAFQTIASHGRAQFAIRDGKYSVVRDVQQSTAVQHITPRNSSNYRYSKAFVDIPHAFRVGFVNPDKDDAADEVLVFREGYSEDGAGETEAATKYETLPYPGCRSATMAWREGAYQFATLLLRPDEHSVDMDVEALRCTKGDLVRFSHDVISIGLASGRIKARSVVEGDVVSFDLDTPVAMADGVTYALRIRHKDGSNTVHVLAAEIGSTIQTVELDTPVAEEDAPEAGDLFMFGEHNLESAPMIIKAIEHGRNFTARVTMVDAASGVHTADSGEIPAFESYITHGRPIKQLEPDAPEITLRSDETALQRLKDGTLLERIVVFLTPPAAKSVPLREWEVEARPFESDSDWTPIARAPMHAGLIGIWDVRAGEVWDVRARVISKHGVASDWTEVLEHTVVGKTTAPNPPSSLSVTAALDGFNVAFTASTSLDVEGYEFRIGGANWDAATVLGRIRGPKGFFTYDLDGVETVRVKAVDVLGLYSTEVTEDSPSAPTAGALAKRNKTTYRQDDEPSDPVEGDLWADTNDAARGVYRYTSSAWVYVADQTSYNTAAAISGQGALATRNTAQYDTSNLYPDPDFVDQSRYSGDPHTFAATASDGGPSLNEIRISAGAGVKEVDSPRFKVDANKPYQFNVFIERRGSGVLTATAYVQWFDALSGGSLISSHTIGSHDGTTPAKQTLLRKAPSNAKSARLKFRKGDEVDTAEGAFSGIDVRRGSDLGAAGLVTREDGETIVTDNDAVTSLGTAAAITGQGPWATKNVIDDWKGLPDNYAGGKGQTWSGDPVSAANSDGFTFTARTLYRTNEDLALPAATLSGLSSSTRYWLFRDRDSSAYSATSSHSTMRGRLRAAANRWVYIGEYTTADGGGSGGGISGGGWGGGGGGGPIP